MPDGPDNIPPDTGSALPRDAAALLPLVYEELRRLAVHRLADERPGQTLQATALVHEAYLRLVGHDPARPWDGRAHFFGAAAEAMRRILVDRARRRQAHKHGGDRVRTELDAVDPAAPEHAEQLLAVDEAMARLHAVDPGAAELVKLRYFVGLSLPEAAAILGMPPRSADRLWAYARAWLRREIER